MEYRFLHKDGCYRWFYTLARADYDAAGTPLSFYAHIVDLTARKQAEDDALARLRDEGERANKTKSEFLSRVSHELRTPLNATLGFAQLLAMDDLRPDQRESVHHILRAGRHLLNLINEVLDISRIEAGRIAISPEIVSVTEVAREAVDIVAPLADRQRLKQIILNLLSNAVKYNCAGGKVAITDVEKDNRVRILITDTGPGIPAESMHRLFTPFERLGAGLGGVEGTGLGLALSKRLAEVMGGTLGAESTPGVGSTFWMELPRAQAPVQLDQGDVAGGDSASAAGPPVACTVLHIEDNPSNHRLVERALARRLQLPDIPGEQILQKLQADPDTRPIPVVVVSADATPDQAKKLAGGAREYLTKPLDVGKLIELVDSTVPMAKARR